MSVSSRTNTRAGRNRKLKLSVKFFLFFLLVSLVSLGSMAIFSSAYFSHILVEREVSSFKALTSSFLSQTENEIQVMDDVSINILYSNLVQDNFTRFLDSESDRHEMFSNLISIFGAFNGANVALPVISVYSNEGEKVSIGAYSTMETVDMDTLPWIEGVGEHRFRKYISLPYASTMMQSSRSVSHYYISLYRMMRDQHGSDIGYIETAQYAEDVFSSILTYRKRMDPDLTVLVFDGEGELIFPFYQIQVDEDLQEHYYRTAVGHEEAREVKNPITGSMELIFGESSGYTGWTYICVQDTDAVLAPVHNASMILMAATLLILLIVTGISYYLSRSVTSPIRDLLKTIDTTNIETLSGEKRHLDSSYNEFDELNDAFHDMSANLKQSMDELIYARQREMESRFLTLQAQINPHFYYNSLSSIIALSESGKSDEVVQFCTNLSRIMRYAAQRRPSIVTLATEIEYAEKYLYCMKVRYQKSLNYTIEVDESLKETPVPRLVIQPLVENAIKYGTDCAPPWTISIRAERQDDGWVIRVCDSGKGFSSEALSEIEGKMAAWNLETRIPADPAAEGGLGLINVYARWRIFCESSFYFHIDSTETGSCVTLGRRGKEA